MLKLCYYNPVTEELTEFNSNEEVCIAPHENTVRRYYLIGEGSPSHATLSITSSTENVEVRILEGKNYNDIYSFEDIETNNTITVFFAPYPSGVIPIDINVKSLTSQKGDYKIGIKIQ